MLRSGRGTEFLYLADNLLMKHIENYSLFIHQTGMIYFPEQEGITEIRPCCRIGYFYQHRYSELMDFCKKHPEYHVVSKLDNGSVFNKSLDYAYSYMLAEGDDGPQLAHLLDVDFSYTDIARRLQRKRQRRDP